MPHHDPAISTDHLGVAISVLVLLLLATAWARIQGSGLMPVLAVTVLSGLWVWVDPVHEPSLYTIGRSHGVTPADLIVIPTLVVAADVLHRTMRGPQPPPPPPD